MTLPEPHEWEVIRTVDLDRHFPPSGPCVFCDHPDARHRIYDAIVGRYKAGEPINAIADDYDITPEIVLDIVMRFAR